MKVSVIIPVYNTGKYLRECLNSVVSQTLKEIEIVCINDGSTDNSLEILHEYKNKYENIKVINRENYGVSSSRNYGKKLAQGEYIFYLDSDDYIDKDLLERCYVNAELNDLDIVCFDAKNHYEQGVNRCKEVKVYSGISRYFAMGNHIVSGEEAFNILVNNKVVGWWTCCIHFYKKKFLDDINLQFDESIMHEDILYTSEAMLKAKSIKHIGVESYNYRIRESSRSESGTTQMHIDAHYICAKKLDTILYKIKFNNPTTELNINRYVNYFYKRAIVDCDRYLNYNMRSEISKSKKMKNTDIELAIQIDSPNIYYTKGLKYRNIAIVDTPNDIEIAIKIVSKYKYYTNDIFINENININQNEIKKLKEIFNNVYTISSKRDFTKIDFLLNNNSYMNIFVSKYDFDVYIQELCRKSPEIKGSIKYIKDE